MPVSLFLAFRDPGGSGLRVDDGDLARFAAIVAATPHFSRALIHTPVIARDPYLQGQVPPVLAAQIYFTDIEPLEAALARNGPLQELVALRSLAGAAASQQAMLARDFPVPGGAREGDKRPDAGKRCSYLVSYEGAAEDLNAWLDHYITQHPPIMARFPGIREIEVCTRIDWRSFLPWRRADSMLRNKVVFDDAAALSAALASPVRHEMRADYQRFPPFTGPVAHDPMDTLELGP
ncbi:MAG: hypothetical protein OEW21_01345 [Betaproteobacteria bacterium]|nr:hypothetical protein [Betaproteobacteria bacterium]